MRPSLHQNLYNTKYQSKSEDYMNKKDITSLKEKTANYIEKKSRRSFIPTLFRLLEVILCSDLIE